MLSGSASVKAVRRTLMKLSPGWMLITGWCDKLLSIYDECFNLLIKIKSERPEKI